MTIHRMDNVLIVVDDRKGPVEGRWAERVVGLDDVRQDIAMLRIPDGPGRVELAKFHRPRAIRAEPTDAPANTLGMRRVVFAGDGIEDVVARLRAHGAELVGEIVQCPLVDLPPPDGLRGALDTKIEHPFLWNLRQGSWRVVCPGFHREVPELSTGRTGVGAHCQWQALASLT